MTLPLGVLKAGKVEFVPAFSAKKQVPLAASLLSRVIPGTINNGTPLMVSFPYYSHIFRDSYGSGMGPEIMNLKFSERNLLVFLHKQILLVFGSIFQ